MGFLRGGFGGILGEFIEVGHNPIDFLVDQGDLPSGEGIERQAIGWCSEKDCRALRANPLCRQERMVPNISGVASRCAINFVGWVLHRELYLSQGFSTTRVPDEGTAGESFWPKPVSGTPGTPPPS